MFKKIRDQLCDQFITSRRKVTYPKFNFRWQKVLRIIPLKNNLNRHDKSKQTTINAISY